MIKRALAAALCLMLVFALLPKAARADSTATLVFDGTNLWLGDNSYTTYTEKPENGSITVSGSRTLTLDDFIFSTSEAIALDLPFNTTLVLEGTNTVTSTKNIGYGDTCGIKCGGALTIRGTGTLTATGGSTSYLDKSSASYGVWVDGENGSITVISGNITGTGGKTTGDSNSYGVYAQRGITANGGSITGTGGKTTGYSSDSYSYGVYSDESISVNGGSITGTGGETTDDGSDSYGVYSVLSITVGSGSIEGKGGTTTGDDGESYGVYSNESITVNGGSIKGTGGTSGSSESPTSGTSYGVHTKVSITASGGSIMGEGGAATVDSYGVRTGGGITASGGSITGTGGAAGEGSYGVFSEAQSVTVENGGTIEGTGGTARTRSFGISATSGGIWLTGGRLVGKSTAGNALSTGPSLPTDYFWRTGESALYTASASAPLPADFKDGAYADIRTGLPITFTEQPADTTVTEGSTGSLEAEVSDPPSGTATLNWYACSASGTPTGPSLGTGGSFTIPSTLTAGSTYYYLCQAEYQEVKINSRVATVTVNAAPVVPTITFTTNPASKTVTAGSITDSLSAAASVSPSGTATLSWYACDVGGTISGGSLGTGGTFAIPSTLTAGTYYYLCQATLTGATLVNSQVATVTVTAPYIRFTTNPANETVVTAGSITGNSLTAAASVFPSGIGTATLDWYACSELGIIPPSSVSRGTGGTFAIPPTLLAGTHYYICLASFSNAWTVRSTVAKVTVNAAPVVPTIAFTTDPASKTVTAGSITGNSLTAAASVSPSGTATLNWYACSAGGAPTGTLLGTGGTFAIPPTLTAGTYHYLCQATFAGATSVNSQVATVTVTTPPTVSTVAVNPASVSVQKGGTQTFRADVYGTNSPAQTVNWTVEGGVTGTSIDSKGVLTVAANETAATLTVKVTSTVDPTKFGVATVTPYMQYVITRGKNGEWTTDGDAGLGFTADGDYSKFSGVSVDGRTLAEDKYTAVSGSTVVTLDADYLDSLSAGRHTLRVSFTDGFAETNFTIQEAAVPDTGDSAQPMLWLGLMLLAGAGLAAGVLIRRRKQNG